MIDYLCLYCCGIVCYTCRGSLDITPFLTSISPLLAGQLVLSLRLKNVLINSGSLEVLVHLLASPHSSLHMLILENLTISSSDYRHLTTAIATSNLTKFTTEDCLHIDVSAAKGLATALTHCKTLKVVIVTELHMARESATILAEAMNHSNVKELWIGRVSKDTVLDCSYPDRVKIEYSW